MSVREPLVVLKPQLLRVADSVGELELGRPVRVAIDGFCASGKTTVSSALSAILRERGTECISITTDDFQHPPEVRWQLGADSPEGFYRHAIDVDALKREVLAPLGPGGSLQYRTSTYDIRNLTPGLSEVRCASAGAILLLDGLFLHAPAFADCFDFTIYVKASYEACIARARERNQEGEPSPDDIEAIYRRRYVKGWEIYVAESRPEQAARVVISNNGVD